jgi:hypothetical protein
MIIETAKAFTQMLTMTGDRENVEFYWDAIYSLCISQRKCSFDVWHQVISLRFRNLYDSPLDGNDPLIALLRR